MGGRIRLLAMGFVEPSALPEWPARTASESLMHRHALLQFFEPMESNVHLVEPLSGFGIRSGQHDEEVFAIGGNVVAARVPRTTTGDDSFDRKRSGLPECERRFRLYINGEHVPNSGCVLKIEDLFAIG